MPGLDSTKTLTATSLICALTMVACTETGPGISPATDAPAGTSTTAAAVHTAEAIPVATPFTSTAHQVPAPTSPLGPLPSFNESPGCGGPQGIRGPYVTAAGDRQPDTESLGGPWGDAFGRDLAEVREHLVEMALPNGEETPVTVLVHELAAPALQRVIESLEAQQAAGNVYPVETVSTHRPSTVDPWSYLSFHAVGAAIDVNHLSNPYSSENELITDMPDWFVKAWTDAGWCWGGDWQTIKDPMHFSWMGPRFSGDAAAAPMIPRTDAAAFDRAISLETGLGAGSPGSTELLADLDRDGAADAVRVGAWSADGPLSVAVARAAYHFDACWALGPTPYAAPPDAEVLLEDRTGDGRPDLWVVDREDGGISLVVYTFLSGFTKHLPPVRAVVPTDPASTILVGDHDRDGEVDLYVIEPGDPVLLTIWRGPGFDSVLLASPLPFAAEPGSRFVLGDREADGIVDLFGLAPGPSPEVVVVPLPAGSVGAVETIETGVASQAGRLQAIDLDGDGRDDLAFFDGHGAVTVYLGGDRDGEADDRLMSWFLVGDDRPWDYRAGCTLGPTGPQ